MIKEIRNAVKQRRVANARKELLTGKRWIVADHKGWGNAIHFDRSDGDSHHWHGWTWTAPKVGDEFVAKTVDGLTAAYMVTSVERQRDPDDMWFATTHRLGEVISADTQVAQAK
jgi:hypothetical protein